MSSRLEGCMRDALEALAKLVPNATDIEDVIDSAALAVRPEDFPPHLRAKAVPITYWVGYLQSIADVADVTVRELLDEHGISIDDAAPAPALPAPKPRKRARQRPLVLKIGKRASFPITTLEEGSRIYQRERDASGEGASTFPVGKIGDVRISYNGRVWLDDKLLLEAVR